MCVCVLDLFFKLYVLYVLFIIRKYYRTHAARRVRVSSGKNTRITVCACVCARMCVYVAFGLSPSGRVHVTVSRVYERTAKYALTKCDDRIRTSDGTA